MEAELCLRFPIAVEQQLKVLVIDDGEYIYRFKDFPDKPLLRALLDFETPKTPTDVIEKYAAVKTELSDFVAYCVAQGILLGPGTQFQTISGQEFAKYLTRCYRSINHELFSHGLWQTLSAGKAKSTLVDGWLIETYFFIKGANARLPNAVGNCTNDGLRHTLLHHYLEEWDHYRFFRQAIELRGLDASRIEARGPMPATKAVMLMARQAGRESSLGYLACSGLLESTGSDSSKAREFYGAIAKHYDTKGTGFVLPMLKHIDLDEEFEHGDLMAEALAAFELISRRDADDVVNTLRIFKETLIQWFDEMVEYYSRDNDLYAYPWSPSFAQGVFK